MAKEKVLLAYSGGLDTSVILKWLTLKGYDVVAYVANVGQDADWDGIKEKAQKSGATEVIVDDLREEFVKDFVFPAVSFNALYEKSIISLQLILFFFKLVQISESYCSLTFFNISFAHFLASFGDSLSSLPFKNPATNTAALTAPHKLPTAMPVPIPLPIAIGIFVLNSSL